MYHYVCERHSLELDFGVAERRQRVPTRVQEREVFPLDEYQGLFGGRSDKGRSFLHVVVRCLSTDGFMNKITTQSPDPYSRADPGAELRV